MPYRPKVYTASRLERAQLWLCMRKDPDWDFVDWTASWPNTVGAVEPTDLSPLEISNSWAVNIAEVRRSDFVMLWGRDEGLRGALVEVGAAIGYGLRVVTVGLPDSHTWSFHPQVTRCYNLIMARTFLYQYTVMVPPASQRKKDAAND